MKSILVANWKMNPASFKEAKLLLDATRKAAEKARSVAVVIAPPAIFLRPLRQQYKGKRVVFGVQNAHQGSGGAFTGEVSILQAKDAKAGYVVIGHAERRAMGETNDDVRMKVAATLRANLVPVLCIGETTRSGSGEHFVRVAEQLKIGLSDVPQGLVKKVLIAYEPVWAIGATKPMTPRDMHEMAIFIRKSIVGQHGEVGMRTKILYGGSIDETNAADMRIHGDVEGLLVGRASSDPKKVTLLIEALNLA